MNQKPNSNKPNALASLRKIIREEVKSAIKEEMVPILLEIIKTGKSTPIVENAAITRTLSNTTKPSSNPFLEQTRQEMLAKIGLGGNTEDFANIISPTRPSFIETPQPVLQEQLEDPMFQVGKMLMTANKSSREENVEINEVPDFSAIMKKMSI